MKWVVGGQQCVRARFELAVGPSHLRHDMAMAGLRYATITPGEKVKKRVDRS